MAEKKKGFSLADALAGVPDVSKSDTPKGPLVMEYADIDDIHPSPFNEKVFTLSDLENLMDLILLEGGLQQPLYVAKDGEGWEIQSGHRRHAALVALVKGSDKHPPHPELRQVPIVYKPEAEAEALGMITDPGKLDEAEVDEVTRLKKELGVLIGNMANRKLTGAELDAAAQELEEHFVALKNLGAEFPGRLREQVAKACQTSETKLARLRVIRENLLPGNYRKMWDVGKLSEQAAYAIARMDPLMQDVLARRKPKGGLNGAVCEQIQKSGMKAYLTREVKCPDGSACTNGENMLAHDAESRYPPSLCGRLYLCCAKCSSKAHCKHACQVAKEAAAKDNADREAEQKREAAKRDKREKAWRDEKLAFADRMRAVVKDEAEFDALGQVVNARVGNQLIFCALYLSRLIFRTGDGEIPNADSFIFPSFRALKVICQETGVSADYLLGLRDDPMTELVAKAQDGQQKPKGNDDVEGTDDGI